MKEFKYYILLDEAGNRISPSYREDEAVPEDVKAKGILVTKDEFTKLLNGYRRDPKTGDYVEIPPYEPTLADAQNAKIAELKAERNKQEISALNNFDVDETSLTRIDIAYKILSAGTAPSIDWTMADNSVQDVTAEDFANLYVALAVRSNALHESYRKAKEQVLAATSKSAVEAVILE